MNKWEAAYKKECEAKGVEQLVGNFDPTRFEVSVERFNALANVLTATEITTLVIGLGRTFGRED